LLDIDAKFVEHFVARFRRLAGNFPILANLFSKINKLNAVYGGGRSHPRTSLRPKKIPCATFEAAKTAPKRGRSSEGVRQKICSFRYLNELSTYFWAGNALSFAQGIRTHRAAK